MAEPAPPKEGEAPKPKASVVRAAKLNDIQKKLRTSPGTPALWAELDAIVEGSPVLTEENAGGPLCEVKADPVKGRVLVATRPLPPGTKVLVDKVLLRVPKEKDGSYTRVRAIYDAMKEARGDPETKNRVLDMACPLDAIPETQRIRIKQDAAHVLKQLDADLRDDYWETYIKQEEAEKILIVWSVNSMTNTVDGSACLAPNAAKLEHNCDPNCSFYFPFADEVYILATRQIAAGENLSVSYIPTGQPTLDRKLLLKMNYHFDCQCPWCSQEGDLARSFSCSHCKGCLLPPNNQWSPSSNCPGLVMAAFSSPSSVGGCQWCGGSSCTQLTTMSGSLPKTDPTLPWRCDCCGTLEEDEERKKKLRAAEEELFGVPAYQREWKRVMDEGLLHPGHHLVVHALTEQLPLEEDKAARISILWAIVRAFDSQGKDLYRDKADYLDALGRLEWEGGRKKEGRASLSHAASLKALHCGRFTHAARRAKELAQSPGGKLTVDEDFTRVMKALEDGSGGAKPGEPKKEAPPPEEATEGEGGATEPPQATSSSE